jgi:hypothetical protein
MLHYRASREDSEAEWLICAKLIVMHSPNCREKWQKWTENPEDTDNH